jgi:hypothetical protein
MNDSKRILVVGSGNVGSRHVQAVLKLKGKLSLDIVEPSEVALNLTKERIAEIPHNKDDFDIKLYRSLSEIKKESDLVIVATTAVGREKIISNLLEKGHRNFIIEKMVCQSKKEYNNLITKFKEFNAKGWVNTARRYFKAYQSLKELFKDEKIVTLSVVAGNRGLGCNAIHYIDLFSWFANSYEVKLNGDYLHDEIYENKRGENLLEFSGTVVGAAKNDSRMSITFLPFESISDVVSIVGKDFHVNINETQEKVHLIEGSVSSPLKYKNEYVSSITSTIIEEIISQGTCGLPSLTDSSFAHIELFRIFNLHIKKITGKEPDLCPIT